MGFGWSFYGFFIAAAVWMALYFVWAFAVATINDQPQPPEEKRRQ